LVASQVTVTLPGVYDVFAGIHSVEQDTSFSFIH